MASDPMRFGNTFSGKAPRNFWLELIPLFFDTSDQRQETADALLPSIPCLKNGFGLLRVFRDSHFKIVPSSTTGDGMSAARSFIHFLTTPTRRSLTLHSPPAFSSRKTEPNLTISDQIPDQTKTKVRKILDTSRLSSSRRNRRWGWRKPGVPEVLGGGGA